MTFRKFEKAKEHIKDKSLQEMMNDNNEKKRNTFFLRLWLMKLFPWLAQFFFEETGNFWIFFFEFHDFDRYVKMSMDSFLSIRISNKLKSSIPTLILSFIVYPENKAINGKIILAELIRNTLLTFFREAYIREAKRQWVFTNCRKIIHPHV